MSKTIANLLTVIFILLSPFSPVFAEKCVQIFYSDQNKMSRAYKESLQYTGYLSNLIAHFPRIQQYIIALSTYKAGDINRCRTNFYIGVNYFAKIPNMFLFDLLKTEKDIVWINTGLHHLSAQHQNILWGGELKTSSDVSDFPNSFTYKGETFKSALDNLRQEGQDIKTVYKGFDPFKVSDPNTNIVSWANIDKEKWPFILKKNNHWLVTMNPFLFMKGDGPYMIFADALFDMLDEKPTQDKHLAFIRVEDISPITKPKTINTYTTLFHSLNIPFGISVIPFYRDPLNIYKDRRYHEKNLSDTPALLKALNNATRHGASIIWHGVDHQLGDQKNPFNGVSGSDFEFWDAVNKAPVQNETTAWYINRLARGKKVFDDVRLYPVAWITPHYHASPFGNIILSKVLPWHIGRVYYTSQHQACHSRSLPKRLQYLNGPSNYSKPIEQLAWLSDLSFKTNNHYPEGNQMFPYVIYGDVYGINVLPESSGNIQPYKSNQVKGIITIDDLLATAKRNLVLRDVWMSFFVHEVILNTKDQGGIAEYPGDISQLHHLLKRIKAMGYRFVDLKTFTKKHNQIKRKPTIYIPPLLACDQ